MKKNKRHDKNNLTETRIKSLIANQVQKILEEQLRQQLGVPNHRNKRNTLETEGSAMSDFHYTSGQIMSTIAKELTGIFLRRF